MSKTLEKKYQKKSDIEHVLSLPGMYIGSIEQHEMEYYVFHHDKERFITQKVKYIPACLKLFDEIIINARDHFIRMKSSTDTNDVNVLFIDVFLDKQFITVTNGGSGIDVAIHPEHKIYIPQLIFASLRTSSNYDDGEEKIVGGKHGIGSKAAFIWSKYVKIETHDHKRHLTYTQEFHNNLTQIDEPVIKKEKKKPYTKIMYQIDFERMGIKEYNDDMIKIFEKRTYDIAALTDKTVKVSFNKIPCGLSGGFTNFYLKRVGFQRIKRTCL